MEMETEDDVAQEGSVEPPSSPVALVMTEEVEAEMAEKPLVRNEELVPSL